MTDVVAEDGEGHGVVVGRSSSGKTYFVRKAIFQAATRRTVFFNTQHEDGFGRGVSRWSLGLLRQPGSKVNLVPPRPSAHEDNREKALAMLRTVVEDLIGVGERAAKDRTCLVRLIVDEAHLFSPKASQHKDDPLQLLSTNGNRYGVKLWSITQRPALLSHTVLSQASTHVVFDLDDFEQPYLKHYGVPDHVQRWIRDPLPGQAPGTPNRRFAVRRGVTWALCRPV